MYDAGEYEATVTGQAMSYTKNNNPQVEVICALKGCTDENGNQVTRTVYMPLTEKTVKNVADELERVFGYVPEKWSHLSPDNSPFVKLSGDVVLYCKHEEYQGAIKERWSFSDPSRGRRPAPEPDQLRSLDAMFGSALTGKKKPPKAVNGAPAAKAETANNDADIPF